MVLDALLFAAKGGGRGAWGGGQSQNGNAVGVENRVTVGDGKATEQSVVVFTWSSSQPGYTWYNSSITPLYLLPPTNCPRITSHNETISSKATKSRGDGILESGLL